MIGEGEGWSVALDDDGVVCVSIAGDAEDQSVQGFLALWQEVIEAHAPCLHLLDASRLELNQLARRWELATRMKNNRALFKKSAVIGLSGPQRVVSHIVIKASGRDNVRIFGDRDEAIAWLLA